jgi:hypothetical protein
MSKTPRKQTLYDAYRFPGFTPGREVKGVFGDRKALVIRLNRRSKKQHVGPVVRFRVAGTIAASEGSGTSPVETVEFTLRWRCAGLIAASVAQ